MTVPFETRQSRYFVEVVDARNFSRAAKRLGLSQPAVSQQVRELESVLRVALLQRQGKRILLTPAGAMFQERAHEILRRIDQTVQEISSEPSGLHGKLRIGVIPYLDVALMPRSLRIFAEAHPGST